MIDLLPDLRTSRREVVLGPADSLPVPTVGSCFFVVATMNNLRQTASPFLGVHRLKLPGWLTELRLVPTSDTTDAQVRKMKKAHATQVREINEQARYARLNWIFDLCPRLHWVTGELLQRGDKSTHHFFVLSGDARDRHFQLNVVSGNWVLPGKPLDGKAPKFEPEEHAALVYAQHEHGGVFVTVYPHSSASGKLDKGHFIIDFVPSPDHLAGIRGDARIRRHLATFLKVARRSMVTHGFSKDDYLNRLSRCSEQYESLYASRDDARRAWNDSRIALGTGLIGGLIASSVIPMLPMIGSEARATIKEHQDSCAVQHYSATICAQHYPRDRMDKLAADGLTTGNVLIGTAVISLLLIRGMQGLFRRR